MKTTLVRDYIKASGGAVSADERCTLEAFADWLVGQGCLMPRDADDLRARLATAREVNDLYRGHTEPEPVRRDLCTCGHTEYMHWNREGHCAAADCQCMKFEREKKDAH